MKNRGKVFKGFALVEVIVLLLATSVAISSSMVGMSVRKSSEVKVDQNVRNCIVVENGESSTDACMAMVNGCKYNQESSCNTLITYANSTNPTYAQFALTALKDSCNNGSKRACDYIIKSCSENSSKCDIASAEGDLSYYLNLNTTSSLAGRAYIEKELQNYYRNGIKNITNEIDTICPTPCNNAGDNYWKTACGVLRSVKGAGFCQDINEDVPKPPNPPPPPAAPTSLTATAASPTTVQLNWNDVATNEDGYYVYQSIGSMSNWSQIKNLAANSTSTLVDLGSTPAGGTYYYMVKGYNATEGPGAPSNIASVFMIGYPNPPTLQNGSFDGTQTVTLTWIDNANNEDGFKVWQKVPSGSWVLNKTIATPNVTTTTIDLGSNPVNGTYSYYLQAYNTVLTSANSNTVDVTVATKPWAPAMSSISQAYTGGNYIVHLCWSDTSHNESGFHVLQKIGAGAETTVATVAANTTCADINLGATPTFATYYYNVDAYNAQGTTLATGGPLSTVAPMVPTAPSGVNAAVTTPTSVSLTWTDNATNEDGFKVYQKIDAGAWALVKTEATPNATATTVSLGATPPPGTYYYKVRAYNTISGESSDSNSASVAVEGYPNPPSGVAASFDGSQTVTVSWTDNASNETGFKVWQKNPSGTFILNKTIATPNTTSTTINIGSNPENGTWQYYVEAYNTDMTSDPSAAATVSVLTPPEGPWGFGLSSGMSGTDHIVTIDWGDNSNNEDGFKLYQSINGGAYTLIDTLPPNTTSKVLNFGFNPTPYGTYTFKVSAFNLAGETWVKYNGTASTIFPSVPHTPASLTSLYDGVQTITLNWTDNSHNEDGYKVYQKVPSGSFVLNKTIAVPNTTSTTINLGATPAQGTYEYYVQAYNATDTSVSSNTASSLVISAPIAPSGVGGSFNGTQTVTLTWTDTAFSEDGFKVWQKTPSGTFILNKTIATPNTTSTTIDTGANPENGTWQYYIQSYNTGYTSANSNTASVAVVTAPLAPSAAAASFDGTQTVTLTWTDNAYNELGFKVYQKTPSGSFVLNKTIATPNTTSTTVDLGANPENGTWQYYVQAYHTTLTSANSNTASVSVATPPVAPSGVTASYDGFQTMTVNWTDNASNETGFKVWQNINGAGMILNKTIATPNTTSTTIDLGANPLTGTYQYYVQAYNVSGTSPNSNTASIYIVTPPAAPSGLSGSFDNWKVVTLNWTDNANNEDGFKIWQKTPSGSFVLNKTIASANVTTTNIDIGLDAENATWQYYVQSYNSNSTSANSNTASVAVVTQVAAPSGASASFNGVQTVTVNWTDNSYNETGFKVYQNINGAGWLLNKTIATPNTTSTTIDLGANPANVTYQYYVQSYNSLFTSGNTNTASVSVVTTPIAPTGLGGSFNGVQTVTLTWTDNAYNETGFKVWQNINAAGWVLNKTIATPNTTSTTIDIGANPPNVTYQYYVQAYHATLTSANSNTASIAIVTSPGAPSGLGGSYNGVQTVTLNWTDNAYNETGFKVWQKTPSGSFVLNKTIATPNTTSTTIDLGANPANGTWQYYVQSYNGSYTSANSNTASVSVYPVPAAASGASASGTSATTVTVSWTDNSYNETGFYVYQSINSTSSWVLVATVGANVTSTVVNLGSTPAGGTYYYKVRAYNSVSGESADSNIPSVSIAGYPNPPSGVGGSFNGTQIVTLNWTDNANNETGFKVWQQVPSGSFVLNKTIAVANTTSTTIDIGANPVNGTYQYYVQAYNAAMTSANSNTASVAVATVPVAPTGLSVPATTNVTATTPVALTWTDASHNETGFKVYRKVPSGSYALLTTTGAGATSYTDNLGASPTTGVYYYKITAVNATGESGYSNEVSTNVILPTPAAPSGFAASKSQSTNFYANLSWTDNSNNETGFRIYQNGSPVTTVGANVTSAQINLGTYPGAGTYTYYAVAYNGSGDSAASNSSAISISAPESCINGCDQGNSSACTTCTNSNYNKSCLQIYNQLPGSTGWHVINAKGTNVSVYCDNTVGDGGWTLIAYSGSTAASMNYWGATSSFASIFYTDATKGVGWQAQNGTWYYWNVSTAPNMTFSAMRMTISGNYNNGAIGGYLAIKNVNDSGTLKLYFLDFSNTDSKGQSLQKDGAWVYGTTSMGSQINETNRAIRWDSGWGPTSFCLKICGAPYPNIGYNKRYFNWMYIR